MRVDRFGIDHPNTLVTLGNLAVMLESVGCPARAEPDDRDETGGTQGVPDPCDLQERLSAYPELLDELGPQPDLEGIYRFVLKTEENIFGADHPTIAIDLGNLALLLEDDDPDQAVSLLRHALRIEEARLGPDHRDLASPLNNLASTLMAAGKNADAEDTLKGALSLLDGEPAPSADRARILHNLGYLHAQREEWPAAADKLRAGFIAAVAADEADIRWESEFGLGAAYSHLQEPALAIFHAKRAINAVQGLRANLMGNQPGLQHAFLTSVEDVYRNLADMLLGQGRLAEAQQVMGLMKEYEYLDFLRWDAALPPQPNTVAYDSFEKQQAALLSDATDSLVQAAE
ncbi:MAG: tetratricopeptide repeat protein, partial [Anaerolineae bacterium]